jgi:hypothetical protein
VERKVKSAMDNKRNNAIVVNKVDVPPETDVVDVSVPRHLPNAYEGATIGWDYELRVAGDKMGPDRHDEMAVTITPGPVDLAGSGVILTTSKATGLGRIGQSPGSTMNSTLLWFGGAGIVALLIGLSSGNNGWLIGGGIVLAISAWIAVRSWKYSRTNIESIAFDVPNRNLHLGEPVTVHVDNTDSRALEAGLIAIEFVIVHGKNSDTTVQHRVFEHWVPVVGRQVQLPTDPRQPSGYPGKEVALHWLVGLREGGVSEQQQKFTERVIPIGLTH